MGLRPVQFVQSVNFTHSPNIRVYGLHVIRRLFTILIILRGVINLKELRTSNCALNYLRGESI